MRIKEILIEAIDGKTKLKVRIIDTPEDKAIIIHPYVIYKSEINGRVMAKVKIEEHWSELYAPGNYDLTLDSFIYAEKIDENFEMPAKINLSHFDDQIYPKKDG